jgi:mannose-1-phosphate guanylyltransferase
VSEPVSRFAAILSGGVGERFWPASTPERPKQLLPFLGRGSLLRQTIERLSPVFSDDRILIITAESLADAIARECPELPSRNIIAEPRSRNTAAAAGVAACAAIALGGEHAALALLPADHVVQDGTEFVRTLERAFQIAEAEGRIVTLGIRPDRPETGYGYITLGEPLPGGAFQISAFHEKPEAWKAELLLEEGRSYWNAGIFITRARILLQEMERYAPAVGEPLMRFLVAGGLPGSGPLERPPSGSGSRRKSHSDSESIGGGTALVAFRELYERAPTISFDEAVMERTDAGAVLPAEFGWDDVGSWEAIARLLETDAAGNVVHGTGVLAEARDNILYSDGGRITVIGADNLLIVRSGSETLVCARDRLPEIKGILRALNVKRS